MYIRMRMRATVKQYSIIVRTRKKKEKVRTKLEQEQIWNSFQGFLDDPGIDNFGEPTSIPGEKMFMFLGVEYESVFPRILGIGMSSVVSLRVPGCVSISVTAHGITASFASITGAVSSVFRVVSSVFPIIFSIGSTIFVLK